MRKLRDNSGIVAILALLMVAILTTVAVAFVAMANSNVMQVDNLSSMQTARMSAESGIAFVGYQLTHGVSVPNGKTPNDMIAWLAGPQSQAGSLNACIAGNLVTLNGGVLPPSPPTLPVPQPWAHLPRVACGADGSFEAFVSVVFRWANATMYIPGNVRSDSDGTEWACSVQHISGNGTFAADRAANPTYWQQTTGQEVTVTVFGYDGTVCRSISMNYMIPAMSSIFNYGIASKSPVNVSGSAQILGANANIFTDATDPIAVTVGGSATVAGDISTVSATTTVSLAGSASVAGVSVSDPAVDAHIHQGVPDVAFPQVNPSVFYPYAVNPVTKTANANLTNICIAANTNPTFTGNTTLYGVIYIKMPNKVTFQGNVQITGVIVTDDATGAPLNTDTITFGGNVDSYPVGNLVGNANNFPAIRAMTGSFILAPGFDLTFNGNSNTTNGCMAANSFSFGGNTGGNITGSMINYSDSQFILFGSSDFTFNKLPANQVPAGFTTPTNYSAEPATYEEW